jgi:AcrR family transcriptional regulator
MAKAKAAERREDALSHDRIVEAAIELLDAEGESGLTFRALAERLATGAGAIYWHVANKGELLAAASDAIIGRAMVNVATHASPQKTIRGIALGVFDALDAHPWVGAQLSRGPWQIGMLQLFERIGRQLQALGVPERAQFTAASTLMSYIFGESDQNATNGSTHSPTASREEFLGVLAARWEALDAREFPFLRSIAPRLRHHDDRAEFLAGVDIILAGIAAFAKEPRGR